VDRVKHSGAVALGLAPISSTLVGPLSPRCMSLPTKHSGAVALGLP